MQCVNCEKTLEPVFGDKDDTSYQYENALWVGFFGGYGMFTDSTWENPPVTLKGADHEAVICHECAHELCATVPWINKLIQPLLSHSHRKEFWEQNPDHEGWDKK